MSVNRGKCTLERVCPSFPTAQLSLLATYCLSLNLSSIFHQHQSNINNHDGSTPQTQAWLPTIARRHVSTQGLEATEAIQRRSTAKRYRDARSTREKRDQTAVASAFAGLLSAAACP